MRTRSNVTSLTLGTSMAAVLDNVGMTSLNETAYLAPLDIDCNNMSTLSSPADCPSLSESFMSDNTTMLEANTSRRRSLASSATSNSPDWRSMNLNNVTSPTTPITEPAFAGAQALKCEQDFDPGSLYNLAQFGLADPETWEDRESVQESLPRMTNATAMQLIGALGMSDQPSSCHLYNTYSQSMSMNPPLSRSIFGIEELLQGSTTAKEEPLWSQPVTSPLQTIVPSAAFQPILTSSPPPTHEPSTPCKRSTFPQGMLMSSPFTLVSPPIVPSQYDVEDLQFEVADIDYSGSKSPTASDYWVSAVTPNRRYGRPTMHRRGYERKRHIGPSSKPRPVAGKSGLNCDAIIAQNEFACGYANCIDKSTGKQKRFKRQEHKKRHEKTVHEKDGSHKCWVPECTTNAFTRTDNLKSHLKNTHGKKSASQRNRYVATQDKNSEYYDPDWVGDLTKEGYPIFMSSI